MKKNIFKVTILLILIVLIIKSIYIFYPRNLGKVMGKDDFINNVTSIEITQIDGKKTKSITITNKNQITETIEYLSKQTVRHIVTTWGSPYTPNAENYTINFNANTLESSGWVSTIGNEYITCFTYKERVSNKTNNIHPYKFTTNFDLNYFRELFNS